MTNHLKLDKLRASIRNNGLDGYIVPRTDEYLGEYVASYAERLSWLTNFTGSAGLAVVLDDKAVVMSDGRYTIQLAAEVDADIFMIANSQQVKLADWLNDNVSEDAVIGYDPKLHTFAEVEKLEEAGITLQAISGNLIDTVWGDQPDHPSSQVQLFSDTIAGRTALEKIELIQNDIQTHDAEAALVTMSDSIAWLLNIRGSDIPFIPVCLSYLIVPKEGKVQWFVNQNKITGEVKDKLKDAVEFFEESEIASALKNLENKKVLFDEKRTPIYFKNILEDVSAGIVFQEDLCLLPRAIKTKNEQNAMKQAHIIDGVALVKFLKWFEEEAPKENLDELKVEAQLEAFRAEASEFKEPSFSTVSGFGANGAIVHYRATEKTNLNITNDNLLLLDSGAQYSLGTTDITRTLMIGDVADEVKEHNTLVLQGHIGLACAKFPKGTDGKALDKLARAPLQEKGLDYAHGTGHGVGCYLSVHEEAAGISPRGEREMEAGMIVSNEPGFYKEGAYGIRIENLILCQETDNENLCFETITLAPISKDLIVKDMLSEGEVDWLDGYHAKVYDTLYPLLDEEHQEWLKQVTAEI